AAHQRAGLPARRREARPLHAPVAPAPERDPQRPARHARLLQHAGEAVPELAERGVTGEALVVALESRLDNLVYRMGFATSRRQARQLVRHRHVQVNGRTLDVPSYRVGPGDEVKIADASRELVLVKHALEQFGRQQPVSWIQVDTDKVLGRMTQRPTRDAIPIAAQEQLIVELYSK